MVDAAERLLSLAGGGAGAVTVSGTHVVDLAQLSLVCLSRATGHLSTLVSALRSQGLWKRAKELRKLQKTLTLLAGNRSSAR